jgi:hypothetical protein
MNIVMLGLQATGKTTYAVGVYAGMTNGMYSGLRLVQVTDSVATLNAGLERLSRRLAVIRTDTEEAETIGLQVQTADDETHDLRVPDRSGEALRGTLHGRSWDSALLDELREAEGLLLFLRPRRVKPGEPVVEVAALAPPADADDGEGSDESPWAPSMMPTDASMVDALQEFCEASGRESIPVAIVISAWDEVEGLTPARWLDTRVPLLAQYLQVNSDRFSPAVFGVSVQGDTFSESNDEDQAEPGEDLIADDEPDPWERASCVDAEGGSVELVAPLVWIIGTDD